MKRLHLVCNAHLDPCWLWEWEEGAAEALSTFRAAADFCESWDGFVFNHNEVTLYKWIEEYEPPLFARIQRLVREGKWHIMGGWYLQPDCNMPSGESFARQMLMGKRYFLEKFGVEPTTAINFDPFGHTRGLVQLLKKGGYDSYVHCRPDQNDCPLPDADYVWVGYDGSEILGYRSIGWYGTPRFGMARPKLDEYLKDNTEREYGLMLWGVGNHGGGPSRRDLTELAEVQNTSPFAIVHSTPEAYFADLRASGRELPRHEADVNSWAPGCYTSQVRLKQKHRLLENELYAAEKMASAAAVQGLADYPAAAIREAMHDLLVGEFHDILPGSSVQQVEEAGLRLFDHGLEIVSRLKARLFFALAAGQPKAAEGEIPVLIHNPHPYPVTGVFECEFNLPDAIFEEQFTVPTVRCDGVALPCQTEQEASNMPLDWRKRVVFHADLAPCAMNRFSCTLENVQPARPAPAMAFENGMLRFRSERVEAVVSGTTGLLEKYVVDGVTYIEGAGVVPLIVKDNEDPWGMLESSYREILGQFTLLEGAANDRISGLPGKGLPPVRVIEDGPVRTVVEAVFGYGDSFLVMTYTLPKIGTELEIHVRVTWNEKSTMLKLAVPTPFGAGEYLGQVAYGRDVLAGAKKEVVAQKWTAARSADGAHTLTVINEGIYGSDFVDGQIRMTLLRSPAYSSHPINDRPPVAQDRFRPRQEQGERQFRLWLNGGAAAARFDAVDREALAHNEKPMALSFCPSGMGAAPLPGVLLEGESALLTAFKRAEDGAGYILRLFEPTGAARKATLRIPALDVVAEIALGPFEVKSLRLNENTLVEVDLIERDLS